VKRMFRCLLLLLLLAAPAFAQTTTTVPDTCVPSTAAEFQSVTADDITFHSLLSLLQKRHYDTTQPQNVQRCTTAGQVSYFAAMPNLRVGEDPAVAFYAPSLPESQRGRTVYKKGSRVTVEATATTTWIVWRDPAGNPIRLKVKNGAGKPMHPAPEPAPQGVRRHL